MISRRDGAPWEVCEELTGSQLLFPGLPRHMEMSNCGTQYRSATRAQLGGSRGYGDGGRIHPALSQWSYNPRPGAYKAVHMSITARCTVGSNDQAACNPYVRVHTRVHMEPLPTLGQPCVSMGDDLGSDTHGLGEACPATVVILSRVMQPHRPIPWGRKGARGARPARVPTALIRRFWCCWCCWYCR